MKTEEFEIEEFDKDDVEVVFWINKVTPKGKRERAFRTYKQKPKKNNYDDFCVENFDGI